MEARAIVALETATPLPRDLLHIIVQMGWCVTWLNIGDECDCEDYMGLVYAGFVRNKGFYQGKHLTLQIHFYGFQHKYDEWHILYADTNDKIWPLHAKTR